MCSSYRAGTHTGPSQFQHREGMLRTKEKTDIWRKKWKTPGHNEHTHSWWHLQCASGCVWLADGPHDGLLEEWQAEITIKSQQCWTYIIYIHSLSFACGSLPSLFASWAFSGLRISVLGRFSRVSLSLFFTYLPPLICFCLHVPNCQSLSISAASALISLPVFLYPVLVYFPADPIYFETGLLPGLPNEDILSNPECVM